MLNLGRGCLILGVVAWGFSCTKYTVAPDAGDARGDAAASETKADGLMPSFDAGDAGLDLAIDRPGDTISGACPDPTSVTTCGDQCVACTVPANTDHATCDGKTCGLVCKPGFHACEDGTCADNKSTMTCGSACKPCSAPMGGSATCDGQVCGMLCPAGTSLCGDKCLAAGTACNGACASGTHNCGGTCRSDMDVNFCGNGCEHCAAPQNGMAVCNGACGVKCNNGFNLCGTSCKAANDPTACGPNCTRCDAPTGGMATCDGMKCGAPTCPNGQKICNNACIDSNRSCNGVCSNGKYSCPDAVCRDINTVASCGTGCQTCPGKVNETPTTCTNGVCGYTCNGGYMRCVDGSCSRTRWDFEDGTVQGWVQDTIPEGGTVTVVVGGHSGSRALSSQFYAAQDGLQVYIGAKGGDLCGGNGLSVQGRTASAWVKLSGPFGDTGCELQYFTAATDFDQMAGPTVTVTPGQWTRLAATVESPMAYRLKVICFTHAAPTGMLQMDIDDVAFE